jgi:hypothetical protein
MNFQGNLRKMRADLQQGEAQYFMRLFDVLEPKEEVPLNDLVGTNIKLEFNNQINCVVTGDKIKKTFGEGMSYKAFISSPNAVESIIRPELSRIHEGIALRDKEWEEAHHNQPHIVYLSKTGGIKVGVTRSTNVPSRWIDQGATEAIFLAETPYRQLAGLIEVELKNHMSDKTNWRNMLKGIITDERNLLDAKDEALELLPESYYDFISDNDDLTEIHYPVLEYPEKLNSLKLDKVAVIEGKLTGIKGQYLMFDKGRVINIRSHSGYQVSLEY